jgi:hypothetical protein
MKYFLACTGLFMENRTDFKELYEFLTTRYSPEQPWYELRSYNEIHDRTGHTLPVFGHEFFLDSGAFSARTLGLTISPKRYGEFVKRYASQITYFANLDVIPQSGKLEDVKVAAKETLENQKRLEDITGMTPVPTFHKGEPIEYLHKYLEEYEFIAIGGLMNKSIRTRTYYDIVWRANTQHKKLHAFGSSSINHLLRYPWYSADSSSWLVQARLGIVMIPQPGTDSKYNFATRPVQVAISDQASARKVEDGNHFDTLSDEQRQYVTEYVATLGLKPSDLRGLAYARFVINCHFFAQFGLAVTRREPPTKRKQVSLL